MEHQDIRLKAKGAGIALWKIADRLGISEPTLTRLLRRKVDKETKARLLDAIKQIKEERKGVENDK